MTAPCIILNQARRRFGGAGGVQDLSLTLPAGQITAILGASGSGKSTLLRLIAGLESLEGGSIHFDGQLMADGRSAIPAQHRNVGLVFQDHALFPHLRVWENVAFGLRAPRAAQQAAALRWLEHVELAHRAQAYPAALSGGEQQRVALARALAPDPRAILLDEPFSSLDPALRTDLRERTRALLAQRGMTTAFVSHDAEEALLLADYLAIMKDGCLLQAGLPQAVYLHPVSADAANALGPTIAWPGVVSCSGLATPIGTLAAPGLNDGARAIGVVRQEALRLAPGDTFSVAAMRPMGRYALAGLPLGAQMLWVRVRPDSAQPGMRTGLAIEASGAHVFPA